MKTSGQIREEIERLYEAIHDLTSELKLAVIQDVAKAKDKQAEEDGAMNEALVVYASASELPAYEKAGFVSGWRAGAKWTEAKGKAIDHAERMREKDAREDRA